MGLAVYLLSFVLLGLALSLSVAGATLETAAAALIVILAHFPAFLPVAAQTKFMGARGKAAGPYPELPVPILIFLSWILAGTVMGDVPWRSALTGLAVAAAVAFCYGAVRVVAFVSAKMASIAGHIPDFSTSTLSDIGRRNIYLVRLEIAVLSCLFALAGLFHFAENVIWLIPIMAGAIPIATLIALSTIGREETLSRTAAAMAFPSLASKFITRPADAAIYYSGHNSTSHAAALTLADQLAAARIPFAIIAREVASSAALAAAATPHIYAVPAVAMLDAFAQPCFRAVLYVNDSEKNSQFCRFNQYVHILIADETIAPQHRLSGNLAIYDAIVAPDDATYAGWRSTAPADIRERIVRIGAPRKANAALFPADKRAITPTRAQLNLILRLHAQTKTTMTDAMFAAAIRKLAATILALPGENAPRLNINFPNKNSLSADPLLGALHAHIERMISGAAAKRDAGTKTDPAVRISMADTINATNQADVIIESAPEHLFDLRGTGKPIFWLGDPDHDVPDDLYPLFPDMTGLEHGLTAIRNGDPLHEARHNAAKTDPSDLVYANYADLINDFAHRKAARAVSP
jgi:hypothetical protein